MVNLPVVLIVMEMEQRAADINAGGSFHGYSYTINHDKVQFLNSYLYYLYLDAYHILCLARHCEASLSAFSI